MRATRKGQPSPMKGRHHSVKSLEKISLGKRGNQYRLRKDVSTDAILQRIQEGASLPQIAVEMGVERHTVLDRYNKVKQSGVAVPELNPTTFKHTEDAKRRIGQASLGHKLSKESRDRIAAAKTKISTELILRRLSEGVTVRQLAQEMGVDRSTIYLRLKKEQGVP